MLKQMAPARERSLVVAASMQAHLSYCFEKRRASRPSPPLGVPCGRLLPWAGAPDLAQIGKHVAAPAPQYPAAVTPAKKIVAQMALAPTGPLLHLWAPPSDYMYQQRAHEDPPRLLLPDIVASLPPQQAPRDGLTANAGPDAGIGARRWRRSDRCSQEQDAWTSQCVRRAATCPLTPNVDPHST